jgi:predicted nucleic acid-binding protein
MRVVIDTNVFISAALKEYSPPGAAVHLAAETHLLLKSAITDKSCSLPWSGRGLRR